MNSQSRAPTKANTEPLMIAAFQPSQPPMNGTIMPPMTPGMLPPVLSTPVATWAFFVICTWQISNVH